MAKRMTELTELTGLTEKKIDKKPRKSASAQPKKIPAKFDEALKETVVRDFAITQSKSKTAENTGIDRASVRRILEADEKAEHTPEELEARKNFIQNCKEEVSRAAWDNANKLARLVGRRIDGALDKQAEIDKLYDILDEVADKEDMKFKEKQAIISKLKRLELDDLRELATTFGIMYDKGALANGDITANTAIKIELSPEVKAMAK